MTQEQRAQELLAGRQEEGTTRTSIRINGLPEEVLQLIKRRAEEHGVSVTVFVSYLLTKAVLDD